MSELITVRGEVVICECSSAECMGVDRTIDLGKQCQFMHTYLKFHSRICVHQVVDLQI